MNTESDKHPHVRGLGMASARSRARLVERLKQLGVGDARIIDAMNRVPRHMFVDEAMTSRAYDDTALPIGYSQTISQPYIVAQMTGLLLGDGEPPAQVLEIGTGSGYQAAVLAELVATVYTTERIKPLYEQARRRLGDLGYRNVHVRQAREDKLGLPSYGPFDAIIVTAGAEQLPTSLYEQMAEGGRMVVPVGEVDGGQRLVVITRQGESFFRDDLDPVSFVPLVDDSS